MKHEELYYLCSLRIDRALRIGVNCRKPTEPLSIPADVYKLVNENSERIINGYAARQGQFPYQVSLRILNAGRTTYCGGSLISNNWVLSAAQCTRTFTQLTMRFGSINLSSGGVTRTTNRVKYHPRSSAASFNNDIPTPLPLANNAYGIQAIPMPRRRPPQTFTGDLATVSGWGATQDSSAMQSVLRWVNVRVISPVDCVQRLPSTSGAQVICTVGDSGVQGMCKGDAGGPLTLSDGGVRTLIGVASYIP